MKTYTKAVSATLAGALAVGMVPAMALAADGDQELELMVTAIEAFEGGKVATVTSVGGTFTEDATLKAWTAQVSVGDAQYIVPATITLKDNAGTVTLNATDYKVSYFKADASGNITSTEVLKPEGIGTYYAVVTAVKGAYAGAELATKFMITGEQINAQIGIWNPTANEFTYQDPTSLVYTAAPQKIGFQVNGTGVDLVEGTDYTVLYYVSGQDPDHVAGSSAIPTDAGSYFAVVKGLGKYAGTSRTLPFTINKYVLDASKAEIDPVYVGEALPTVPTTVNGSAELAKHFVLDYAGLGNTSGKGNFKPVIKLANEKDPNVEAVAANTKVDVDRYAAEASATYADAAMPASINVVTAKTSTFYNEALIKMFAGTTDLTSLKTVKYLNAADRSAASVTGTTINTTPGAYIVVVEYFAADHSVGGQYEIAVNVTTDNIDGATNSYFYYGGNVVSGTLELPYSGSNVDVTGKLMNNDKVPSEITSGTTVNYYDANGKKVSAIKDAGTYTVKIENKGYTLTNNTLTVVVKPIDIAELRINGLSPINGKPALQFQDADLISSIDLEYGVDVDGNGVIKDTTTPAVTEWANVNGAGLPVKVVWTKDGKEVDEVKALGKYEVSLVLTNAADAKNYKISAKAFDFEVTTALDFVDVPATHWAYEVIHTAKDNGYVNGYGDGKLYGPDNAIKRADFVCVLFNMAGCPTTQPISGSFVDGWQYDLGFTDVNERAYYAEALAWAEETGIANGWVENGKKVFGPSKFISRQEALCMLANYADMVGDFAAPADADALLAKYSDGAKTSKWAKDSVAWAVSEKIAGNGKVLNPLGNITRAEVAAIAVNYQPEELA